MADCFNPRKRSLIMSGIRSNGNRTTELRFVQLLRKYKIKHWRRKYSLHGQPDFVFTHCKLAVFIDGDFWHGNPSKFRLPKSNRFYWRQKIKRNRERDHQVNNTLKKMGWRVIRFWESSLKNEAAIVAKLKRIMES